jgi:hypothetical protein
MEHLEGRKNAYFEGFVELGVVGSSPMCASTRDNRVSEPQPEIWVVSSVAVMRCHVMACNSSKSTMLTDNSVEQT